MKRRIVLSISSLTIALTMLLATAVSAKTGEYSSMNEIPTTVISNDGYCQESVCEDDTSGYQLCSFRSLVENDHVDVEITADDFVSGLVAPDLTISGTVRIDSSIIDINEYYDFDKVDRFSIVRWGVEQEIITESQKYEIYCKLINESKLENISCLTNVVKELQDAVNNDDVSDDIKTTIRETVSSLTPRGSNARVYDSANFSVIYDTLISRQEAINVADFAETMRTQFINMQFRQPIKPTGESRYTITLLAGGDPNNEAAASSTPNDPWGENTCGVTFTILGFTSLNDDIRGHIVHEYFHGIQWAYNCDYVTNQTAWFAEAAANWASTIVNGIYPTSESFIPGYINSRNSITSEIDNVNYGTTLFPLTIGHLYGYSAIRKIYEEYANYPKNLMFSDLKNIIDTALGADEFGGSFDEAYCTMANYKYSPAEYFEDIHPGGEPITSSWNPRIEDITTSLMHGKNITPYSAASNQSIQSYSSDYFKFSPDASCQDALINLTISFSGSGANDGVCYTHFEANNGFKMFYELTKTGTNTYTASFMNYGEYTQSVGLIISNLSTGAISYSVLYTVEQGTTETLNIPSNNRYTEEIMSLGEKEYKDFIVSFANAGNRVFQTFGTKDTYLELYNMSGTKLAGGSSTDDAGYASNALISYNFTANTQYRIRVTFYSPTVTGDIRLAFVTTPSIDEYEDIYTLNDYTMGLTNSFTRYEVDWYVYNYTTARERTMTLTSSVDTYLYIIDPRSTEPIVEANNDIPGMTENVSSLYNDDYEDSNSQISKRFYSNVPYLVIASAYNPSSSSSVGSYQININ